MTVSVPSPLLLVAVLIVVIAGYLALMVPIGNWAKHKLYLAYAKRQAAKLNMSTEDFLSMVEETDLNP